MIKTKSALSAAAATLVGCSQGPQVDDDITKLETPIDYDRGTPAQIFHAPTFDPQDPKIFVFYAFNIDRGGYVGSTTEISPSIREYGFNGLDTHWGVSYVDQDGILIRADISKKTGNIDWILAQGWDKDPNSPYRAWRVQLEPQLDGSCVAMYQVAARTTEVALDQSYDDLEQIVQLSTVQALNEISNAHVGKVALSNSKVEKAILSFALSTILENIRDHFPALRETK